MITAEVFGRKKENKISQYYEVTTCFFDWRKKKNFFGIAYLSVDILTVNPTNMNMEQGYIAMLVKFKNGSQVIPAFNPLKD